MLSLRSYLSRPEEYTIEGMLMIYDILFIEWINLCIKIIQKMSNEYESNENKSISRFVLLMNMLTTTCIKLLCNQLYFHRLDEI